MTISDDPSRLLASFLALVLIHGCASSDRSNKVEQPVPALHHAPGASATPSGDAGQLMEGMGKVDFPITTNSKEAQAYFNQGVAQLYGFWFVPAEQSFIQAAKLDPQAAMAYWGIAMAAPATFLPMYQLVLGPGPRLPPDAPPNSPEFRARAAIAKAQSLRESVTPRERLYIDAVAAFHNAQLRDPDAAYISGMKMIVASFADDKEAKAILALSLEDGYDPSTKSPRGGTSESLKLLRQVLTTDPNHAGANHFLIHALEGSNQLRDAVPIADRYAALAPNIPHVLHMPGHVYAQIGMYDEAVKAFLAADAKEREYMAADPNYSRLSFTHNEILLLHVLGSQGRYKDAISRIGALMSSNEANPGERQFIYRIGWFSLMKTLVRFEKWSEILDGKTLPFFNQPFETLWYHWARGLAYASTGNTAGARSSLEQFQQLIQALGFNPVPPQFQIAGSELEAYIDVSTGNLTKGFEGLNRAAKSESLMPYTDPTVYPRPVLELLGKAAIRARDFRTAESAYRRALENEPGSGRALWGLATAYEGLGRKQESEKMMMEFRRVWRGEDSSGQELK
jgi:tetratricopeptide (TPR) repeat protein